MKLSKYCQRFVVLALMAVLVAGFAACGDDDSNGGGGGDQSSSAGAGQENAVKVGSEYIGGEPGKADASLSPITFGWVNQDESPAGSVPENTAAVKSAIRFVNEELGGIDGHPIKLVQCRIGASQEQGKQCAQKFLNDPEIKAVLYGYDIVAGQPFFSTMAPDGKESKKPVIGFSPSSPDDGALKNVYWTGGGFLTIGATPYFFKDYLKASSVASVWPDTSTDVFIDPTKQAFDAAGVKFSVAKIPPSGTDVVGPLVAGGVQEADGIFALPDDSSQCIAMAKGAEQLNVLEKPTVAFPVCLQTATKDALGDFPKWIYFRDTLSPNVPDPSGQVDTLKYVAQKYAGGQAEDVVQGPSSVGSFGVLMLAAKWMNAIGADNITDEALAEQAKAMTAGGIWMGDPEAKFGTPPFTSIASLGNKFYKYEGDGKWSDAANGDWVAAPTEG